MTPRCLSIGNHDHGGNVSAQIAYTDVQARWKYPDWFYSFSTHFKDAETNGEVTVEFLMIDTVIAASSDGRYSEEMKEEWPHLDQLPKDAPTAEAQWEWIEKTLAASTASAPA